MSNTEPGKIVTLIRRIFKITKKRGCRLSNTIFDISEQKYTEERVRTMAELLDVAPNSIMIHDFEGNIKYANRKTFELHGYDNEQEFMALNLHQIDVPESEALIAERMRSSLATTAQLTMNGSADATRLLAYRSRLKSIEGEKSGMGAVCQMAHCEP